MTRNNYDDNDDIERGNYKYYQSELKKQKDEGCCTRICQEVCQHPVTALEAIPKGRIINVTDTFYMHSSPSSLLWDTLFMFLKFLFLGLSVDVLVRGVILKNINATTTTITDNDDETTDDDDVFDMAYFSQWCLCIGIVYFFVSFLNSLISFCQKGSSQPSAVQNRVSCMIAFLWCWYPIALVLSAFNFFMYWILVYNPNYLWSDDNNNTNEPQEQEEMSYFVLMKNVGIFVFLWFEGQIVNRIPLRWSHLVGVEWVFMVYLIFMVVYSTATKTTTSEGGNDGNNEEEMATIYWFANWNSAYLKETALGCVIVMSAVLPTLFLFFYGLSWPYRRYMPVVVSGEEDDEENHTDDYTPIHSNDHDEDGEDVIEYTIPPGRLGIVLMDQPPVIQAIAEDSPLRDVVREGLVVDWLELEDGTKYYNMDAIELTSILGDHTHSEHRTLRFINPDVIPLTIPDPEDQEQSRQQQEQQPLTLNLPSGSIGLVFAKGSPPKISRVKETSPLLEMHTEEELLGMLVDTLTLTETGETFYEMETKQMTNLLKENRHSEGRILSLILPHMDVTPQPFQDEEEQQPESVYGGDGSGMPSELIVTIPPGPLLVRLEGSPPRIDSMHPDSPLWDYGVVEGMVVDTLEFGDELYCEMSSNEFKTVTKQYATRDDRTIRFIDPTVHSITAAPSNASIMSGSGTYHSRRSQTSSRGGRNSVASSSIKNKKKKKRGDDYSSQEEDVKDSLMAMGFDEKMIHESILHHRDMGGPMDADDCMNWIIEQE